MQRPRIPIWVASRWPSRRPLRSAARWDGLFPIELPGPDELAVLGQEVRELREAAGAPTNDGAFDLVVEISAGEDPQPWVRAGATWVLTGFGSQPRLDEVRAAIEAGAHS